MQVFEEAEKSAARMRRWPSLLAPAPILSLLVPLLLVLLGIPRAEASSLFFIEPGAPSSLDQSPSARWVTFETGHFLFHSPESLSAWAADVAARAEPIHEAVVALVGFRRPADDAKVEVLVLDPTAQANGSAIPFLDRPVVILWATPPESDSAIGSNREWGELVFGHELAHVLHLGRPRTGSSPFRRWLWPLGPLAIGAPRWVSEGYATLVEGELTGSGRPGGVARAALIRKWAAAGRLPGYDEMSRSSGWIGGSYAYLVGSAFLEWLEAREGKGSLVRLWKGAATGRGLDFEEAFRRTFGKKAPELYARFVAESTAAALDAEKKVGAAGRSEGALWQRLGGEGDAPEVSPDGKRILVLRRRPDEPAELIVWTLEPTESERKGEEKRLELEKKRLEDPEEVPDKPEEAPPREPERTLRAWNGRAPGDARWFPDSRRILFARRSPDPRGRLRSDLWSWDRESGEVKRLTRSADLVHPDPLPDGRRAVAVRRRGGASELVVVDLEGGNVRPLPGELPEARPFDPLEFPRFDPSGERLVFLRHHDGRWELVLAERPFDPNASIRRVDLAGAEPAGPPAWSRDGKRLFVTTDRDGTWNVEEVDPSGDVVRPLSRMLGSLRSPAPEPKGESFFALSLEPGGEELRRVPIEPAKDDAGSFRAPLFRSDGGDAISAWPRGRAPRLAGDARQPVEPQPYSPLAAGHFRWGGGFSFSPSGRVVEPGLVFEDPANRVDAILAASLGDRGGSTGAGLAFRWRGAAAADLLGRLFVLRERPGDRVDEPRAGLDADRLGLELGFERLRFFDSGQIDLDGGILVERLREVGGGDGADLDRRLLRAGGGGSWRRSVAEWSVRAEAGLTGLLGSTGGESWRAFRGEAGLEGGTPLGSFSVRGEAGRVGGDPSRRDLFALGGGGSSLAPDADLWRIVESFALPFAIAEGERFDSLRVAWEPRDGLAFWGSSSRFGPVDRFESGATRLRVAGIELSFRIEEAPIPVGGTLSLVAGAARIFDDPMKGRTVGYIGATVRP